MLSMAVMMHDRYILLFAVETKKSWIILFHPTRYAYTGYTAVMMSHDHSQSLALFASLTSSRMILGLPVGK